MARRFYINGNSTLWLNNEEVLGIGTVAIWRIVWGNPDRIIIQADMPMTDKVKQLLKLNSFTLGLYHKEVGRLDTLEGATLIMTFENCVLNRRWIPRPMALTAEYQVVTAFAEFTCNIVEYNT